MSNMSYSCLMPPTIFIVLSLLASALTLYETSPFIYLTLVADVLIYISSMPAISYYLSKALESQVPSCLNLQSAQAIVILGADILRGDDEDRVGKLTLERLALGSRLHRHLRLPVAVTGGRLSGSQHSLGQLMQDALKNNFFVNAKWVEQDSHNTFQQAKNVSGLLKSANIQTVAVVAQPADIPRVIWSLKKAGLETLACPTSTTYFGAFNIASFLPSARSFDETFYALHEIVGLIYYQMRY